MGQEAYNNTVYSYIVPYVFNCTLNVLIYKQNPEEALIQQIEYKKDKHTEYEINLLFKEKDYDIFYKNYFYTKNYNEMDNLISNEKDEKLNIFKSQEHYNKNLNRRSSSQYPNNMTLTNLQLSTKYKVEDTEKEGRKYILQCSKSNNLGNNNNITNFGGEDKYVNVINDYGKNKNKNVKYERLTQKKNTFQEKNLSESRIYKMLAKGENCHKKDCPNMIIKENILNLCDFCIVNEIKSYILKTYLMYLQLDIDTNNANKLKQYFSKAEIKLSEDRNISLLKVITDLSLNFEELFTKVRTNICLWCWKNIEENNYFIKLPCDCKICSKNCLRNM